MPAIRFPLFIFLTVSLLQAGDPGYEAGWKDSHIALSNFESSNLPLILINTDGQQIPDEPKIDAGMKIIFNGEGALNRLTDEPTDYNGKIGIELRGRSSYYYPQKPYLLETRDSLGNNNNVSLLEMPAENDWVLIPMYNDKSMMRFTLGFDLFRAMGHYSVRARLVEVFLNEDYRGLYVFCESIKQDKNRVDIAELKPDENSGDDITGGYIIKIDYYTDSDSWLSGYSPIDHPERNIYFVYHYPKWDDITEPQKFYIQSFIDTVETALYDDRFSDPEKGFRKYLDENSFVDYFILSELSRNVDGYKKSRYLYKDKNSKGAKLHAGPVWDFDWAWKNVNECYFSATDGSGWAWRTNDCNPGVACPGWYVRLLRDGAFTERVISRYAELRKSRLALDQINAYIDSVTAYVDEAKDRHFELWPIELDYRTPEVDPPSKTYKEEITKLKNWITRRINWLDSHMPDLREQVITSVENDAECALLPGVMHVKNYPNPFNPSTTIYYTVPYSGGIDLSIYNGIGERIETIVHARHPAGSYEARFDASHLPSGIYYCRIQAGSVTSVIKLVLLR